MCHARPLLHRVTEAVVVAAPLEFLLHENLVQVWGNSIKRFLAISCFFLCRCFDYESDSSGPLDVTVLNILPQNDQRRHSSLL